MIQSSSAAAIKGFVRMKTEVFYGEFVLSIMNAEIYVKRIHAFGRKEFTPYHRHSHLELHYESSGRTVLDLNSQQTEMLISEAWILIGQDVHHEETVPEPSTGYCLEFEIVSAEKNSPLSLWRDLTWFKKEGDPETGRILAQILLEADERRPGYQDACRALFITLFVHLIRQFPGQDNALGKRQAAQMNMKTMVDDYFNRVFGGSGALLSPGELAAILHVTPRQVSRILRKHYGQTFAELLNRTRVRYAEHLLLTTDLTVGQISAKCGVSDTYLIRIFQNSRGVSPLRYRKSNKNDGS